MKRTRRSILTYGTAFAAALALHAALAAGLGGAMRTAADRRPEEPPPAEERTLAVTFHRPQPASMSPEPAPAVTRLRQPVPAPAPVPEPEVAAIPPEPSPAMAPAPEPPSPEPEAALPEPEPVAAALPAAREEPAPARYPYSRDTAYSTASRTTRPRPGAPLVRTEKARPLEPIDAEALYPIGARLRGEEGAVRLTVHIGMDGRVQGLEVRSSSGFVALDRAAKRAVRQTRFSPGTRDDRPVADELTITIRFQLDS